MHTLMKYVSCGFRAAVRASRSSPQMTTTVPRQAQRPSRLPTITTAERKHLLDSLPEDQGEEDSEAWVQTITAARMDTDRAVFPD
jgi:hypothetical protein